MAVLKQGNWLHFLTAEGYLNPGFKVDDSDIGSFSVVSNSAGGANAKRYDEQLERLLKRMSSLGLDIVRIEVDSSVVAHLPLEARVLGLDYPIRTGQVDDFSQLRREIGTAQIPIGQSPDARGGNRNRRIRIHLRSDGPGPEEFINEEVLETSGADTMASSGQLVEAINSLTRDEVMSAIDEWRSIGREHFFKQFQVNRAFRYLIRIGDEKFDAKAVVVAALRMHRPELGQFDTARFNGNAQTIAIPLRRLGLDVVDLELDKREIEEDELERQILNRQVEGPVERLQLVRSRRGQGIFRDNVLSREPRCRVTGVSDPRFLRASHIKPWRVSTDTERIDGNNGLMLAPHVDFLFDQGFITFADTGEMMVSAQLESGLLEKWGIPEQIKVGPFSNDQVFFLAYHRLEVFRD